MSDTLSSKSKSDPSFGSRSEADDSKKCEVLTPASPTIAATTKAPDNVSKTGLTSDAARRQLAKFGPNAMPDIGVHPLAMAVEKFWAPVPWMLEAAIVLELLLGKWLEAAIIALLLVFNAALGLLQESRAQATLAALKSRLALTASVKRDGAWKTVPATDLAPGDLVKLSLGGVVAADVKLTGGEVLLDQSMLTGESVPIEAGPGLQTYAGALVRRGEAEAEVTATGTRTKFGRTAELVRTAHVVSTQQKAVLRVVRNLAGDCQESCVRGHSDADGGRLWRSRKTLWINFWTAAIRRRFSTRMGFSTS
jgi:H+-transporting ATPase